MNRLCSFLLLLSLLSSVGSVHSGDLLSGPRLTLIDRQLNSTSWSAANLVDDNLSTRWLSNQQVNDLNFVFGNSRPSVCFDQIELVNYGNDDRSIERFMLMRTLDDSLDSDAETAGWVPIAADANPTGLINHAMWAQGGRLAAIDAQLNSTSWAAANIHDGDTRSRWLSRKSNNVLEFEFDTDWDGDSDDTINIQELLITNYGNDDRSVNTFQIEYSLDGLNWAKLEVPGSGPGEPDYNFALSWQGGALEAIDAQLNSTSWSAANLHDGDNNSRWLSRKSSNQLTFSFDADGDGSTGSVGDSDDYFTLEKIYLSNYGNDDRSVREFQVEVKTLANPNWTKLEVPGSSSGEADYNFALGAQGGQLVVINSQLNTSSWAAANLHDGDSNSRWLSRSSNNQLEFNFDADGDGITGLAGDADDLFTLEQIYLQNYGTDDRSIREFQVEVKTLANPSWSKLTVPGSSSGEPDFNFLLRDNGAQLQSIDSQLNTSSWAAANIHDGDNNSRWLSRKPHNLLDFIFDTDDDSSSGLAGDSDDLFSIEKIYLANYGNDDRSVQQFQIEVKTQANPSWHKLEVPGSVAGEAGHNYTLVANGGSLTGIDSQLNTSSWAAANIHDGNASTRWLSRKQANTLTFGFDTDSDGNAGDGISLDTLLFSNYGADDRSVQSFEIDIQIASGGWQTINAPGGGTQFLPAMSSSEQSWAIGPYSNVTATRIRTLSNYGDPSYTGAREIAFVGDSVTPSYNFTAAMHGNGQTFTLDVADQPVAVTAARLRTVSNYGDPTYTGARELRLLGPSIAESTTFVAAMHGNGESFVLEADKQPVDVTAVRFRTVSNHGDPSYTGARELQLLGPSIAASNTFTAAMHGNGETFVLDAEDQPVDVTDLRFISISNHGDASYTGARELALLGPSVTASTTFSLPMTSGPHQITLDAEDSVSDVTSVRLITIDNHGDPSYTGLAELELLGDPEGPDYVFQAQMGTAAQTYLFTPSMGRVFRFHSLSNHGDPSYTGASELALQESDNCIMAEWRMDEEVWDGTADEVYDSAGNGYQGTSQHSISTALEGDAGGGICRVGDFDALANGYIDTSSLVGLGESYTLTGWFNSADIKKKDQWIVADDDGSDGSFILSLDKDKISFSHQGVNPGSLSTKPQVSVDQWYFVAAVLDTSANKRRIYLFDATGALIEEAIDKKAYSDPLDASPGNATLGGEPGDASQSKRFNGYLDEVKVFKGVLAQADLQVIVDYERQKFNWDGTLRACADAGGIELEVTLPASASTCVPADVTLGVLDGNGNLNSSYTGTVNLSTSSGHGRWLIGDGQGTLGPDPINDDGRASYTFVAADGGSVMLQLSNGHADRLTVTVEEPEESVSDTSELVSFGDNVIVICQQGSNFVNCGDNSPLPDPLYDIVAGRDHSLRAEMWQKDATDGTCSVAAGYNQKDFKAWLSRAIGDAGGEAPKLVGLSTLTLPEALPTSNNVQLDFVDGQASFVWRTTDVGLHYLNLRDDSSGFARDESDTPLTIEASSVDWSVRPFGLWVSAVGNAADSGSASEPKYVEAGADFDISVKAVRWQSVDDVLPIGNPDGHPDGHDDTDPSNNADLSDNDPTKAFGNEGETVALSAYLVAPIPGNDPGLSGVAGSAGFVNGVATVSGARYTEVGLIEISSSLTSGDYQGSGIDLTGRSGYVGRFIPARLALSTNIPVLDDQCSGFSYMDTDLEFTLPPEITVTAQNGSGVETLNYHDDFWKLVKTLGDRSYANAASAALTSFESTSGATASVWDGGTVADGSGRLTLPSDSVRYGRTELQGPFDASIDLLLPDTDLKDSDGACYLIDSNNDGDYLDEADCQDYTLEDISGTELMFGRLRVESGFGPETENLPIQAQTEYFNGVEFVRNVQDSCSPIAIDIFDPALGRVASGALISVGAGSSALQINEPVVDLGDSALVFGAPGSGNTGEIEFQLSDQNNAASSGIGSLPWLLFDWDGDDNFDDDPGVRKASFGRYRGHDRVIFWQENFSR
ncbi:MAG: LamG domain-containing protein [Halopseudomonas sp.]